MSAELGPAGEIARGVRAGTLSAQTLAQESLARAQRLNPALNAMVEIHRDEALEQARRIDALVAAGKDPGPLAGVPIAVKDNIALSWGRTTCASEYLREYRSPFTATAAQRLVDAGAVLIGKTNLDEFAMGSGSEHSCHGPARNPWDTARVPGGSSGGSAAAVAAGIVPVALGSDTGGSIRQPASLCGCVGLKPTYGRVSRWGLVAYASSLDQIGPITTCVRDAALVTDVLCGFDPLDSTCAQLGATDLATRVDLPVEGCVIGVPGQAHDPSNSPGTASALGGAIEQLRSMGATIIDVDLPHTKYGIAAYYLIATAEASSNLARFDGVRYGRRAELGPGEDLHELYCRSRTQGLGREVLKRIMLGTHALSSGYYDAYYLSALKVRRLIKQDYDAAFARGCCAILMPSSPFPAWRVGEMDADPLAAYLADVYTVGVNLAGLPAINVPAGFERVGTSELPVGVQLIGSALDEDRLLRVARTLEGRLPAWRVAPV